MTGDLSAAVISAEGNSRSDLEPGNDICIFALWGLLTDVSYMLTEPYWRCDEIGKGSFLCR